MKKPIMVGLGYQRQQGKDTLADLVVGYLTALGRKAVVASFATPLKQLCMSVYGLTHEQCFGGEEDKNSLTKVMAYELPSGPIAEPAHNLLTARQVLQRVGVAVRDIFPGIWANAPFRRYEGSDFDFVLVPDVRFEDEAENFIQSDGCLIKVVRDTQLSKDPHVSENSLGHFTRWSEIVVNDGTLDDLKAVARQIARDLHEKGTVNEVADSTKITHAYAGTSYDVWQHWPRPRA